MSWFHDAFGFEEMCENEGTIIKRDTNVKKYLQFNTATCTFEPLHGENGEDASLYTGHFSTPNVQQLRTIVADLISSSKQRDGHLKEHVVEGNAFDLHMNPDFYGSVFQVASQFNCLEMVSPAVSPDMGITRYMSDPTQGPACAMACPAGTLYRNYYVDKTHINEHHRLVYPHPTSESIINTKKSNVSSTKSGDVILGQTGNAANAIDNSHDMHLILCSYMIENNIHKEKIQRDGVWHMQNGYMMPNDEHVFVAAMQAVAMNEDLRLQMVAALRVGVHWDTALAPEYEHTKVSKGKFARKRKHYPSNHMATQRRVSQVYASAVPVSYTRISEKQWEPLAQVVLDASYEATFLVAAIKALEQTSEQEMTTAPTSHTPKRMKVIMTKLGGGAFGNSRSWITKAIERAREACKHLPLDVYEVRYRR